MEIFIYSIQKWRWRPRFGGHWRISTLVFQFLVCYAYCFELFVECYMPLFACDNKFFGFYLLLSRHYETRKS